MHPSHSVIFFTTASGAGYGLLALIGVLAPLSALPQDMRFGLVALLLALLAITAGLLSSLLHLGRPERAWRALSQYRTSWLSREGVASVATYLPAGLFAVAWIFLGTVSLPLGLLAALGAAITVYCTGMIYQSLKPVPRWHNAWVVPNYLALALMNGSLWLVLVAQFFAPHPALSVLAIAAIALAAALKLGYWRSIDTATAVSTAGSATGLGSFGTVRHFAAPHTSENYLLKEMGYRIARKHAAKLRRIALVLGFGLPAVLSVLPLVSSGWPALIAALVAAVLATIGVFVERWLFFAEAKHVVTLYYGDEAI
ncbi:MAG: dimethyl sulfoxide reductase anchor subunit [Alphaproteobacteria bacterium]|nr:dimethyl sulfoxide reductase anchor subunit [Alphaproteobacteria bacterium]MCW5744222.1 dimethyl sulfoxide reductase anchor subunit [Alphaproteobacteria bacterium]